MFYLVKGGVAVMVGLDAGVCAVAEENLQRGLGFGVWGLGLGVWGFGVGGWGFKVWGLGVHESHLNALRVTPSGCVHATRVTHSPTQIITVTLHASPRVTRLFTFHEEPHSTINYMSGVLPLPVAASTATPPSNKATSTSRWPSCKGGLGVAGWGLGVGGWGLGVGVWRLGTGVWGLGFRPTFCTEACKAVRPA